MDSLQSKHTFNFFDRALTHLHSDGQQTEREFSIYSEGQFNRELAIERRRTERSQKPFMLMLINVLNANRQNGKGDVVKNIITSLAVTTRAIDTIGWYINNEIIGVIFVEIERCDIDRIKKCIAHRIYLKVNEILDQDTIKKVNVSFHIFPEQGEIDSRELCDIRLYHDITADQGLKRFSLILKRGIDIFGSIFGLILFSPLFLIIAILIKATSKGPVFYKQKRVGQFGKPFTFLKFRSMYVACDEKIHQDYIKEFICRSNNGNNKRRTASGVEIYKITDDPRITTIGNFLRKASLDELPQFFNVLKGEMSLVGPRPPILYELAHYDIWHRRRISDMKPGITGPWQVEKRSMTTFDEMVRLDIQYCEKWSIIMDLWLLFKTPLAMFTGKGAC
jgi:lipopolysaccharide/colanic/teichoic acid biosynthesis glycosyltransferase